MRGMKNRFISLHRPVIWGKENEYVAEAIRRGEPASGPFVERFEQALAERLKCPHVIAVSSGTAALHLALMASGVGPGDQVLVPDLTFAATANAVRLCGGWPIVIDVEPDHWQMDPERVKDCMESDTTPRALLPVDLMGHPCDRARLRKLVSQYRLHYIEDRAESLGTEMADDPGIGIACFSFNGNKVMTAGGGGAVATDNADIAARIRLLRNQGSDPTDPGGHIEAGSNYRMPNMMAALGLAQLENLDTILANKRSIADYYTKALADLELVELPRVAPGVKPNWWLYTVLVPQAAMNRLVQAFADADIEVRRMFRPLSSLKAFRGRHPYVPFQSQSFRIYARALCLPSGPGLTRKDQARVVEVLRRELRGG